jgi:hypothetical protein
MATEDQPVTMLLRRWAGGDHGALERLTPILYDELRRLAGAQMRRERAGHTLSPTALLAARPSNLVPYEGLVEALSMLAPLRPVQRCASLDEAASVWRSWPGTPTPYTERRLAEIEAGRAGCR